MGGRLGGHVQKLCHGDHLALAHHGVVLAPAASLPHTAGKIIAQPVGNKAYALGQENRLCRGLGPVSRRRHEGLVRSTALCCHAKLCTDDVGHFLGHKPVGGELAAKDGHQAFHAVFCMVADMEAPGCGTACIGTRRVQGPCSGKDAQYPVGVDGREKGPAKVQQAQHFVCRGAEIRRIVHSLGRRAQYGHRAVGNKDVAVAAFVQPVDHVAGNAPVEDNERALVRCQGQMDARALYNLGTPGTGCIDNHLAGNAHCLACLRIADLDAGDTAVFRQYAQHLVIGIEGAAIAFGAHGIVQDQPESVYCGIRHLEDPLHGRIKAGLHTQCFLRIDLCGLNACLAAAGCPAGNIGRIIFLCQHKEALSFVYAA